MDTFHRLSKELASHGLDICVPFTAEFYNDHFGEHPPIPTLSSSGCTLSILVANNKNLWDHFKQHLILNPSAIDVRNPLDDYVASCIQASLINVVGLSTRTDVRFAFDKGDKFVAFQNLGQMIGEAFYNRSVFLCSHPVYGPWQAFRAVITIGVDASDVRLDFEELNDPYPESSEKVSIHMQDYFNAVKREGGPQESGPKHVYKYLVAARDAATRPDQQAYRYSEEQIEYHYTKRKDVLRRLISK